MNMAGYLDSTNLKPEATKNDIERLCLEAVRYKMAAVCLHPYRLSLARQLLKDSGVKLCTVIGFPLGAEGIEVKTFAARQALQNGAEELDMVINLGAVKDSHWNSVLAEIEAILKLKNEYDYILKVIVETALLTETELIRITQYLGDSGADFIKTSTGLSTRGVSVEDVQLISRVRSPNLKIKASGGIRGLDFALQLLAAGADRLGTSQAASLIDEYMQTQPT
jgi:deoxyribose-phosphate aldolase